MRVFKNYTTEIVQIIQNHAKQDFCPRMYYIVSTTLFFLDVFLRSKASVTTGRTCLVILRVLRGLPVVAPVAERSVKIVLNLLRVRRKRNRSLTCESEVSRTILFGDELPLATCGNRRNRNSVLRLSCIKLAKGSYKTFAFYVTCKSIVTTSFFASRQLHRKFI